MILFFLLLSMALTGSQSSTCISFSTINGFGSDMIAWDTFWQTFWSLVTGNQNLSLVGTVDISLNAAIALSYIDPTVASGERSFHRMGREWQLLIWLIPQKPDQCITSSRMADIHLANWYVEVDKIMDYLRVCCAEIFLIYFIWVSYLRRHWGN